MSFLSFLLNSRVGINSRLLSSTFRSLSSVLNSSVGMNVSLLLLTPSSRSDGASLREGSTVRTFSSTSIIVILSCFSNSFSGREARSGFWAAVNENNLEPARKVAGTLVRRADFKSTYNRNLPCSSANSDIGSFTGICETRNAPMLGRFWKACSSKWPCSLP